MTDSNSSKEQFSITDDEYANVLTEPSLANVIEHMMSLLNSLIADDTDAAIMEEQCVAQSVRAIDSTKLSRSQLDVFWNEYVKIHDRIVETAKRTQADIRQSLLNKNIVGKKIYAYQKMGAYGV